MARTVPSENPARRSQRWTQFFVNEQPKLLNHAICLAADLPSATQIEWLSPLAADEYAEYSDQNFIDLLNLPALVRPLSTFWPNGGACWDALATGGGSKVILVESKANVPELASKPTQAKSPVSRKRILDSLAEVQQAFGVCEERRRPELWANAFYQYANRLAHLYFLRVLNGVDAHIVFLNFVNDPDSGKDAVRSVAEWQSLMRLVETCLGLPRGENGLKRFVHHIHLDVGNL